MRTDLNYLKKELTRLTDINYLKKEISRLKLEVRKFDMQRHLPPRAKERIEGLEDRFRDALKSLKDLQHQVDSNLDRFVTLVRARTSALRAKRSVSAAARGKTKRKATRKTAKKAAKKRSSK